MTKTQNLAPPLTPLEFDEPDFARAEKMARKLGYEQFAYTSTSGLWGLFCLAENPEYSEGPKTGGCIIKTKEFGLIFIQDEEDLGIE